MPSVAENELLISPLSGIPATKDMVVDVACLEREYCERRPDLEDPNQRVIFGTVSQPRFVPETKVSRRFTS